MHPYQEEIWHKFQEACMNQQLHLDKLKDKKVHSKKMKVETKKNRKTVWAATELTRSGQGH